MSIYSIRKINEKNVRILLTALLKNVIMYTSAQH
ncbi:hypothetical protein VPHF86_0236 [Vibrio phage F86]